MAHCLAALAIALSFLAAPASAAPVKLILVGDSTMASRSGYGDAFCQRFQPPHACINLARSGRSSGSFRAEGRWDQVQALLRDSTPYSATYVLIQFGHNDQPGKPGRSTDLATQFPDNIRRYAAEVTALGGVPVLLTPLTRRSFNGPYLRDDLAPWSAAIRKVAATQRVALLDLNALSTSAVQAMGQKEADTLAQLEPIEKFDRTHLGPKGAAFFANIVADELVRVLPSLAPLTRPASAATAATDRAHEIAPADGWAGQQGGTQGGAAASMADTFTVTNRTELLAAIASTGTPKLIKVAAEIDMAEGRPYASSAEQATRGAVRLGSNTSLIGIGASAGFVNAHLHVADQSQVIIRNLHFRNPCDVGPVWDPADGSKGNWNSLFDSITVSGSTHVWIDHNSFTDAPATDDTFPIENGMRKQCHDGALDISKASDFVTVSYNRFALHEKNTLIGSGDRATGDDGHLRVTLSNNMFENVVARAPRVRFGKVHVFNNYYLGSRTHPGYPHEYSVGVGKQAKIISDHNAFEIAGARDCAQLVRNPGSSAPGAFVDTGSVLNGEPLAQCPFGTASEWSVPYPFTPRPASEIAAHVASNAGAGRLGATPCPGAGLYFCDDFAHGRSAYWQAPADGNGVLAVRSDAPLAAVPSADYFVEAQFQPSPSSGKRQMMHLLGRYADPRNWLGTGITIGDGGEVQVEIVNMQAGAMSPLKQFSRPRVAIDRPLTLRMDMIGKTVTVYLNGERIGTAMLPSATARGRIGWHTASGTDTGIGVTTIRVGDPSLKPARLSLALPANNVTAHAGDAALSIGALATGADGTPQAFTASSSDPAVVGVTVKAGVATLLPHAAGKARIVLASAADPRVQNHIDATIAPAFTQPALTYALARAVYPRIGTAAPIDTTLRIDFDRPPRLGTSGSVRIYRQRDDALVDVIPLGDDIAAIGHAGQAQLRRLRHTPIQVRGNSATIKPHSHKLAYGTAYYVAVGDGVFNDTAIAGVPFAGIGKAARWSFRTVAAAPRGTRLTVDDDGLADFRSVQGAIDHAVKAFGRATPVAIDIRNGRYEELLFVRGKDNLTLKGESRDGVLLHYTNNDTRNPGTGVSQSADAVTPSGGRALLLVEDADLLTLDTLTLNNTTLRSPSISAQAETLFFNNDRGRLIARNASFLSEQDTVQLTGYAWFYRSLVAGNVDFIWGANRAALFEDSEIRSVGDSANPANGGYVVQARTVSADDSGFVFLNSRLTHGPGPGPGAADIPPGTTYLARSPGTPTSWDNVSFINCKMDNHVAATGWAGLGVNGQPAPNPGASSASGGWREFGSTDLTGKPLDPGARVGGKLLDAREAAARFSPRAAVFSAFNSGQGWNPAP